ncbi:MAG: aminotransferase class V-fold PLP-dependent enzyme [Roseburia sp.]|nr:aminotransferase class V-fold PLP-dependent enzyme [Roseburia sp.]MCM1242309.1 aminotransferase class V-fold PLP-dependent enzyme [Roseburia sp.]
MRKIYDSLVTYCDSDFYPYHMPGHKRRSDIGILPDALGIDITEIDGFDNLHQAEGLIKEAQERAAALYGAQESFFLVNGSTCGILAAISAATEKGDTILLARNCHRSVYHAVFLQELHVRYLYPGRIMEYDIADAISPAEVEAALREWSECCAVVITSPTYEGIVSDIGEIAAIVHAAGKILIVDEAHGAHFGLAEGLPENAVRQGADIVIHSLHKTLPSMTQTALLHVNGPRVNRMKLRRYLNIYQSSSPSYVLMAGIDACISYMKETAQKCFMKMRGYHDDFMRQMATCRHIHIGAPENIRNVRRKPYAFLTWDICKLLISVKETSMSGQALYDTLREEFHLQMEMAAGSYVLAIMTIADTKEGWQRLADALQQIDDRIEDRIKEGVKGKAKGNVESGAGSRTDEIEKLPEAGDKQPVTKMTIAQALHLIDRHYEAGRIQGQKLLLTEAAGRIIGNFINLYPPGIPLLVPGELIEEDMIRQIQEYQKLGLRVQGISAEGKVIIC